MVWGDLLFDRIAKISHASLLLLQVNVAQPAVEQHFTRKEFELQAELLVVDVGIPSQIQQRIIEVCQGLLEVTEEKIRDTLLEVGNGEVLIQPHRPLVTFDLRDRQLSGKMSATRLSWPPTALSCSPSVACMTPQLNRIFEVSDMLSKALSDSSNSLLS